MPFPRSALLRLAKQPDSLGGLAEDVAVVAQDVDLVLLPGTADAVDRLSRLGLACSAIVTRHLKFKQNC